MAYLFNTTLSKRELLRRVGDISSVADAAEYEFTSGKARGMRAIEVKNGAGLQFTVLPDRGMDISHASFRGLPLSYLSKVGHASPAHYDEKDFLRNFTGGLLTTCGLSYCGWPCEDEGEALGLHGRIANAPAYDVGVTREWIDDEYYITLRGTCSQTKVFGENLILRREIKIKMGENKILLRDEIENAGFTPSPLMLIYHFNFGYPLLDETAKLYTNNELYRPLNDRAKENAGDRFCFTAPEHGFREHVFLYRSATAPYARLVNEKRGLDLTLTYAREHLPYLIEWKQMGESEYVLGLEPCNVSPEGRAVHRQRGELPFLEAQESRQFQFSISLNGSGGCHG